MSQRTPWYLSLFSTLIVATAALADDQETCRERAGARSIAACSRVISGGTVRGAELAALHTLRGSLYRDVGSHDRAIADFTQAIALLKDLASDEGIAAAYLTRAAAYIAKGDLQGALADYRAAAALDANNNAIRDGIARIEAALASPTQTLPPMGGPLVEPPPRLAYGPPPERALPPPERPASVLKKSLWDHNGSVMYLVANGAQRKFFYEQPRDGLRNAGVHEGTLLFEGRKQADQYVGTAYTFSAACGAHSYSVSGPVSPDQRQVTLYGMAPRFNSACQQVRLEDDTLVFTFTGD